MRIGSEMGLRVLQTRLDIIGNNIANVNTPGFKAGEVKFAEALHGAMETSEPIDAEPEQLVSGRRLNLEQGTVIDSGSLWNMAIEGEGFFQVQMSDGTIAYTRAGTFERDAEGQLTTTTGELLYPSIKIADGVTAPQIEADGTIVGTVNGEKKTLGTIQLAYFANPDGLNQIGDNLFLATESSGAPQLGGPGQGKLGTLRPGALESSNVNLAQEMTNLLEAQRAYQFNTRLIRHNDQMYQQANQLRR